MKPEKLRQREVLKYYQSWLESSSGFHTNSTSHLARSHPDKPHIRISRDNALIAFAQLGCLRLDVKRSIVTLIDTDYQYILAEATKTLSLVSGDGDYDVDDEIWFGSACLPRDQGVSGDALTPPNYTALGRDGLTYTTPALVVEDMTKHEVYGSRAYAGKGVNFYCGVPIETESGVPIGVYTVTDDKPRHGLTPSELRFMRDMAATVMRHLDSVSNEAARFRGETMVLGLGRFISGASSIHVDGQIPPNSKNQTASSEGSVPDATPARVFKGITVTAVDHSRFRSTQTNGALKEKSHKQPSGSLSSTDPPLQKPLNPDANHISKDPVRGLQSEAHASKGSSVAPAANGEPNSTPSGIFSRAALILQECMAADGVLFFDAVSSNFARSSHVVETKPWCANDDNNNAHPDETSKRTEDGTYSLLEHKDGVPSTLSAGSEESDMGFPNDAETRMCRLLGYAFDASNESAANVEILENIKMTERSLSKLIKRYPQGKFFSCQSGSGFSTSDGEFLQSEGPSGPDRVKQRKTITSDGSKRIPRAISDELERLVPHAQSIVWLPLWDFSKQRWSAGLFLWSRRPDRLVAAQDDLVYLTAFANSIMVEVVRQDCAVADTAKSTFIANISHELRTPLHGILGNLDILQDTELSEFQQSLITAIEVCGRTLSDTIDHVLDYSKINQLSKHRKRLASHPGSSASAMPDASGNSKDSMIEMDFDVAAIVEEAVEAAYASFAFQSSGRTKFRAPAADAESSIETPLVPTKKSHNVHVIVNFEHRADWRAHSQPSAIRRIVTNLFGNALKYTEKGTIEVMLSSPRSSPTSTSVSGVPLTLTIKDTGRGMSVDFVRDHAFTPFSQESQFSIGTGLGLSIVQQIVKSLGGKIELRSDQGVGTEIKVSLHLPSPQTEGQASSTLVSLPLKQDLPKLAGRLLRIVAAEASSDERVPRRLRPVVASLEKMAHVWYGLKVVTTLGPGKSYADFVLYVTPPTSLQLQQSASSSSSHHGSHNRSIVIAYDTIQKASLTMRYAELSSMGILVDIISYPLGPRKLERVLIDQLAYATLHGSSTVALIGSTLRNVSSSPAAPTTTLDNTTLPVQHPAISISTASPASDNTVSPLPTAHIAPFVPLLDHPLPLLKPSEFAEKAGHNALRIPPELVQRSSDDCSQQGGTSFDRPCVTPRSISAPSPLISAADGIPLGEPILRVLLVDDNDINLSILRTCMKRAQISHDFAKDGLQAKNLFEQAYKSKNGFTHVLMDVSMPIMDGIQATREIREFERRRRSVGKTALRAERFHAGIPSSVEDDGVAPGARAVHSSALIIALSGVASEAAQQEMLLAGADMFLPKPVKLKELLKILSSQDPAQ